MKTESKEIGFEMILDHEIEELVAIRRIARRDGNVRMASKADRMLDAAGVMVKDTPFGTTWHRA